MEFLLDPGIWIGLLTLIVLEIVLGIDNLVFIAILADKLPPEQRDKARVIGLSLALLMRLGLLFAISWLVTLTKPLITIFDWTFSGRDLILLLGGVLTLAERSVATIMTPRSQISWININETPEKIREQILSVPHSLFPVCRGSLDKVLSVVRAKEILEVLDDEEQLKTLLKRYRPIFIFEKMKVINAINTLRTSKGSLVLVNVNRTGFVGDFFI
jgi:hypothetical protein